MRIVERICRWLALPVACLMGGCGNLSGIGGTAEYGCKAPAGVRCQSVSTTYAEAAKAGMSASAPPEPRPGQVSISPLPAVAPLRSPPHFLRLWIKRWEDGDHDLIDQSHVYVRIDDGRWDVPYVSGTVAGATDTAGRTRVVASAPSAKESPSGTIPVPEPQKGAQDVERSKP